MKSESVTGMADNSATVLGRLKELSIPYTPYHHPKDITLQAFYETMSLDWSKTALCKNVLLTNRQGTAHYLMLMPPFLPYRTGVVSKLLGVSRLSFAPKESLPRYLGCESGALNPLGLIFDEGLAVQAVMDSSLCGLRSLLFHPCVSHMTVEISTADFLHRFLPACAHSMTMITLPQEQE